MVHAITYRAAVTLSAILSGLSQTGRTTWLGEGAAVLQGVRVCCDRSDGERVAVRQDGEDGAVFIWLGVPRACRR